MAKKILYMSDFSTHAKYMLHNWPSFADLAVEFGETTQTLMDLLPDSAVLEDVFNGGFSFCFRSLAQILVQIERLLVVVRVHTEDSSQLTPALLALFDCSEVPLTRLVPAKLEKIRKKILNKISGFNQLLRDLHVNCCGIAKTHLREYDVMLNENEQHELAFIDSRRGLIKRLDNLSLKTLAKEDVLSFEDYFRYKLSVVIKNAFFRLQQHRSDNEVEQLLRKLKPCFEILRREKDKFVAEHIQPLQQLVAQAIVAV